MRGRCFKTAGVTATKGPQNNPKITSHHHHHHHRRRRLLACRLPACPLAHRCRPSPGLLLTGPVAPRQRDSVVPTLKRRRASSTPPTKVRPALLENNRDVPASKRRAPAATTSRWPLRSASSALRSWQRPSPKLRMLDARLDMS